MRGLNIRLCVKADPWEKTEQTWFHGRCGEMFRVLDVHHANVRVYEVDVRSLVLSGHLDIERAFVPATFAEEIPD